MNVLELPRPNQSHSMTVLLLLLILVVNPSQSSLCKCFYCTIRRNDFTRTSTAGCRRSCRLGSERGRRKGWELTEEVLRRWRRVEEQLHRSG